MVLGNGIILRADRGGVPGASVLFNGEERVNFLPDGRIRIVTHGQNSRVESCRINACLPAPYQVRSRGAYMALRHGMRTLAVFLSSTTFDPTSPPLPPDDPSGQVTEFDPTEMPTGGWQNKGAA